MNNYRVTATNRAAKFRFSAVWLAANMEHALASLKFLYPDCSYTVESDQEGEMPLVPCSPTAPRLLSSERTMLSVFLVNSREFRQEMLDRAIRDPQTSGALIECMRWNMTT